MQFKKCNGVQFKGLSEVLLNKSFLIICVEKNFVLLEQQAKSQGMYYNGQCPFNLSAGHNHDLLLFSALLCQQVVGELTIL